MTFHKPMNTSIMRKNISYITLACAALLTVSCALPINLVHRKERKSTPVQYGTATADTANTATIPWRTFFADPYLIALIDSALKNNQELNIVLQEINIAQYEVRARKGAYLPYIGVGAGAGVEKVGRYTSQGANDANTDIKPGVRTPEVLGDFVVGVNASWEVDIWKRLRNAKKRRCITISLRWKAKTLW